LNAVIYARYSSEKQTEQSIEGQVRECEAFAKANNIAIIDSYIDRAISGKTDNRPAFQKMIADSAKKQFEAVIVYRLDRFSRNRYDSAVNKQKLKKNGVYILSAMEHLNGSPESIIMESLLVGMAEYYSVELSQKITRGMKENALKGKALGGSHVLGYRVNSEKHYVIDEQTAPIVREIFKLYNDGKTVKEICDILNERSVKTARGGRYNKNSLHTILTNCKYIGIYKTKYGELTDVIPPIVDRELFCDVGLRMKQNKKAPARAKANINYLLSTKLFCGECGSAMVGESGTGKLGKKYYYYACVKKKREQACKKSNVKKEWIEQLVIQHTISDILQDEIIEHIADRLVELQAKEWAENNMLEYLQSSLVNIQMSIKNILNAIEKGIITDSTKERLTELEDQKKNLEIEISKESISHRVISKHQIIFWISGFKGGNITNVKYCQQLIDTFVNSVFVYDGKVIITYNYSGDHNTVTVSDLDLSSSPKIRIRRPFFGSRVRTLFICYYSCNSIKPVKTASNVVQLFP
jgi:site-specific DNA recombinase